MDPLEAVAFQSLADQNGFDIFVRTGNASRVANVGRFGMRPKPAGVYQKTNKAASFPGVVLYHGEDVEKGKKDVRNIRRPHSTHSKRALRGLRALARERLRLDKLAPGIFGVRDSAGNLIYGDIDIHGVYRRADGQRRADRVGGLTFVPLFNAKLMETGLYGPSLLAHRNVAPKGPGARKPARKTPMVTKRYGVLPHHPIQHGAHDAWAKRNDTAYAGGVNMGPLPGVIHFQPNAKPRHIPTVAGYKRVLESLGHGRNYTEAAWLNGHKRDTLVARHAGR
ncbi:hypothetical protein DWV00_29130 [Trinickia dinghuensis]|uniref:Uncharacterized protein n=1 Tax=Trinickia dinghuensis TaxID=2291023 RepID=A0A3D8JRA0_9BURK|nr:hypothetical protein DWV00_29130 [Trinickia dinghuensis]